MLTNDVVSFEQLGPGAELGVLSQFYVLEVEPWIKSARPRMTLKACTLLLRLISVFV